MSQPHLLFHDNTLDYLFPMQPSKGGRATLALRASENDVREALVCFGGLNYAMTLHERREGYDYFRVRVPVGEQPVRYYFHVTFHDGDVCNFDRRGAYAPAADASPRMHFLLVPGYRTPEWAHGAVFYQIFVDRFCNGDASNDVLNGEYYYYGKPVCKARDWSAPPAATDDFRQFYGGDLQGVIDKLDYLSDLGVDAIYLNPVFISPSSHKYDTQDYEHIDPHMGRIVSDYGDLPDKRTVDNRLSTRYIGRTTHPDNLEASDRLFQTLVERAHKRGIKVILDGVFNHCGSFHAWMDKERIYETATGKREGAYVNPDSPFRDYFAFRTHQWPENDDYEGWWDYGTLPKLNYEGSAALEEYIIDVGRKWVSAPYYADGWRLDVAADLGHSKEYNLQFWTKFRAAVKAANPNAVIIAEHYGDASYWLQNGVWDSVMNYDGFMDPVSYFLTGMEKHSDEFHPELIGDQAAFWRAVRGNYGESFTTQSLYMAMNEISNHDHSRFLTRTNQKVGRVETLGWEAAEDDVRFEVFRQAAIIQFTWPGAPTIYYGDEAGLAGFTDPDNRRAYPWGNEDTKLIAFHKELIRIRHSCPEMRTGAIKEVRTERGVLSFGRFTMSATSLIVVNTNRHALTRDFDMRAIGAPYECTMQRLIISTEDGYRTDVVDRHVKDGVLTLVLPPSSALIVRYDANQPISKEEFWKRHFIRFDD